MRSYAAGGSVGVGDMSLSSLGNKSSSREQDPVLFRSDRYVQWEDNSSTDAGLR